VRNSGLGIDGRFATGTESSFRLPGTEFPMERPLDPMPNLSNRHPLSVGSGKSGRQVSGYNNYSYRFKLAT